MNFDRERDMFDQVKSFLPNLFSDWSRLFYAREVPTGKRRSDIVACSMKGEEFDEIEDQLRYLRKITPPQRYAIAMTLCEEDCSIHAFQKKFYKSAKAVKENVIIPLLEMGLLCRISRYRYAPSEWISYLQSQTLAIELKLHNWKEALKQARVYREHCDETFIALDADTITREMERTARNEMLGLLAVSSQDCDLLVDSDHGSRISVKRNAYRLRVLSSLQRFGNGNSWKQLEMN